MKHYINCTASTLTSIHLQKGSISQTTGPSMHVFMFSFCYSLARIFEVESDGVVFGIHHASYVVAQWRIQ